MLSGLILQGLSSFRENFSDPLDKGHFITGDRLMQELIIIGASGFGREVAWLVERINKCKRTWNLLGFLDDNDSLQGKIINGYEVLGTTQYIFKYQYAYYVCAIGSAAVRERVISQIKTKFPNIRFATLIDPTVEVSNYTHIGEGTIICAHTLITVNIYIGKHVIINLDCTIGHDSAISDFVTIYPSANISGATHIGLCTEIGTGAQIIQGKRIGEHSIIGAGAVVVSDISSNCTAVGCPAKPIKN